MQNLNFVNKELIKTLVYTTASKDRTAYADVMIDGRKYLKMGTLQAVTIVGNVFKVWNDETEMNEYWLFAGMSKQNPIDLNCNKQLAMETAAEKALMNPFMIMQVSKTFGQHSFSDMMSVYVQDLDLEFVKTAKEIAKLNND